MTYRTTFGWSLLTSGIVTLAVLSGDSVWWEIAFLVLGAATLLRRQSRVRIRDGASPRSRRDGRRRPAGHSASAPAASSPRGRVIVNAGVETRTGVPEVTPANRSTSSNSPFREIGAASYCLPTEAQAYSPA